MGLLDSTTQQAYYQGNSHGNYQFTSLTDIINQFMVVYVGEDKLISKIKRVDVAFHAQRALQELSFDTFKSTKAQEITLPPSLQMTLPQDYVNYTKVSWVDSAGIKHLLYPASKTSNPTPIFQDSDSEYYVSAVGSYTATSSLEFTLDKQDDNILVGMEIITPNNPPLIVTNTETVAGVTVVEFGAPPTSWVYPHTQLGVVVPFSGVPLKFKNTDGSLTLQANSQHSLIGTHISSTNNIRVISGDINNIEEGMLVSSEGFPLGTVVTGIFIGETINSTIGNITTSENTSESRSNTTITFTSPVNDSETLSNYKSGTPSENQDDYQDDTYWPMDGSRYGLDPQHAQANGSFYIDDQSGKIHFSSNVSGKTVILDYISDSLGTDGEMQVHKFAEEAMYKWISHAILSGRANVPEYQVNRFKKERFAAIRTAKLRLSNIKLEEITQILRGKSKQIKH